MFWQPAELDSQVRGAEPMTADESVAIPDLTDNKWEAFARALHEWCRPLRRPPGRRLDVPAPESARDDQRPVMDLVLIHAAG